MEFHAKKLRAEHGLVSSNQKTLIFAKVFEGDIS